MKDKTNSKEANAVYLEHIHRIVETIDSTDYIRKIYTIVKHLSEAK